jgi:hypothetical protein
MAEVIRETLKRDLFGQAYTTADHLADALMAAGFGPVKAAATGALRDAADMVRDKDHRRDLHPEDRHAVGWSQALNEAEHELRQRAATIEGNPNA